MIVRALIIVGLLVAATASASAEVDPDAEAWDLLQRGTALYQKGEYEPARVALARARELVPGRVPTIDRWLGLADARLGRCADAVGELERFLASSPVDPEAIADVTAVRDGCKEALATRGTLSVETAPPGAEVRLDAEDPKTPPVGLTPLSIESATLGDHLVSVRRDGFRPASRIVSIEGGRRTEVQLTLVPLAAPPPLVAGCPLPLKPVWKRRWFWPVVLGTVVVTVGVAVGVGVAASRPSFPTLTFQ